MAPYRHEDRVIHSLPRRQAGITAIGFLFLAAVFGIVGLAVVKVLPLYLEKMRIEAVLSDMERDLPGSGKNAAGIRLEMDSRFYVEGVQLPRQDVSIRQVRDGYEVHVQHEARASFLADLWFLVVVDDKVEIPR